LLRLTLLGIGAMASPRYRPAGLLVEHAGARVMIDGGPGACPTGRLDDWLVTDALGELMPSIRRLARRRGIEPAVKRFARGGLSIVPRRVVHTSHAAFGYLIRAPRQGEAARVRARRPPDPARSRRGRELSIRRARKRESYLLKDK
jgi:hypothetical protein